jgi:predicted O-methyltransferase YrrM
MTVLQVWRSTAPIPAARGDRPRGRSRLLRGIRRATAPLLVPLAARRLRRAAGDPVDLVFGFDCGGVVIAPMQDPGELRALVELLAEDPPRVVLEIGTARGGTLYAFARVAADDAVLVSVDLPGGAFGGGYPRWRAPLYRAFARGAQRVELLRGDSQDGAMLTRVRELLDGRPVDFLFVDGDHSYDGVRRDVELYTPLLRDGGVVALHDIVPQGTNAADGPEYLVGGVPEYWRELRERHATTRELVADWDQGRFGIGVLHLTSAGPPPTAPA